MSNLQPGNFRARALGAALGYTTNEKEQIAVQLEILDDGYAGETITWYGYFSEKAVDRTLESLRLLGWQGDDLCDLKGIGETEVRVVLAEDEYDGKVVLKVKWINGAGGLALKAPMNESQSKTFSQRMKGFVLSHNQKSKVQTTPRQAPPPRSNGNGSRMHHDEQPPPHDDDDMPF